MKKQSFKMFIIRYLLGITKSILGIIGIISIIENRILPIHYLSYKKIKSIYKTCSMVNLNIFVFIQKWNDIVITLFSFTRSITLVFIVFCIRHKFKNIKLFPLLFDDENFLTFGNKIEVNENKKHDISLSKLLFFYQQRRKKIRWALLHL